MIERMVGGQMQMKEALGTITIKRDEEGGSART